MHTTHKYVQYASTHAILANKWGTIFVKTGMIVTTVGTNRTIEQIDARTIDRTFTQLHTHFRAQDAQSGQRERESEELRSASLNIQNKRHAVFAWSWQLLDEKRWATCVPYTHLADCGKIKRLALQPSVFLHEQLFIARRAVLIVCVIDRHNRLHEWNIRMKYWKFGCYDYATYLVVTANRYVLEVFLITAGLH